MQTLRAADMIWLRVRLGELAEPGPRTTKEWRTGGTLYLFNPELCTPLRESSRESEETIASIAIVKLIQIRRLYKQVVS